MSSRQWREQERRFDFVPREFIDRAVGDDGRFNGSFVMKRQQVVMLRTSLFLPAMRRISFTGWDPPSFTHLLPHVTQPTVFIVCGVDLLKNQADVKTLLAMSGVHVA